MKLKLKFPLPCLAWSSQCEGGGQVRGGQLNILDNIMSALQSHLFAGLALPHGILQVDKPGPVEDEGGDGEDEVEGEVGPALVLAAVHQDEVADQEGETQHDVNISRIQTIVSEGEERGEYTVQSVVNSELM